MREYHGHSDRRWDKVVLAKLHNQYPDELMCLVEGRGLHRLPVLKPNAAVFLDEPSLDLEDQDGPFRIGQDKIRFRELGSLYADLE